MLCDTWAYNSFRYMLCYTWVYTYVEYKIVLSLQELNETKNLIHDMYIVTSDVWKLQNMHNWPPLSYFSLKDSRCQQLFMCYLKKNLPVTGWSKLKTKQNQVYAGILSEWNQHRLAW